MSNESGGFWGSDSADVGSREHLESASPSNDLLCGGELPESLKDPQKVLKRGRELLEQHFKAIGSHDDDCECYFCDFDCGGTDCDAPERTATTTIKSNIVVYLSEHGIEYKTIKEAAIDDIKCQPFFV